MNMNTNSISNGHQSRFIPQSLRNLFPPYHRSAAKTPGAESRDYRAQDRVAYNPDGTYSHGKPLGGETQFGIEGKVPAPAFGMTERAVALFMLHARAAAFVGESLETVKTEGGRVFDARYAELKAQFEGRVAAARRLIEPLQARVDALRGESGALPSVMRNERNKYSVPTDWRLAALIALLALWVFVIYSEWINAAARQIYLVQDWKTAMYATVPWLAVPIVLEWLLVSAVGAAGVFWKRVWRVVTVASIFGYALLYALRHGGSAEAQVATAITAAMEGISVAAQNTVLDQGLFLGQLVFGLVCGATLLEACLRLIVGREVIVTNPDRERLEAECASVIERINQESAPLSKAEGHLAEYEASRAGFIDFGVRAYRAAEGERQIFDVERQMLERERDLLERRRRALHN